MKKKLENVELVIFDMDGVMFDTENLGIKGWEYAFDYFNMPIPRNVLLKKIGLNSRDSKKMMIDEIGHDFDYDAVKKQKRKYVQDYITEKGTPLKKGLTELLNCIDSLGIKKAIATSRSKEMTDNYIAHADINNNFDTVITGNMVEKGKPNPDIFLYASQICGTPPSKCVVIEDSLNGIKAAYNAGMKAIMIPDLVKPDSDIKDMIYEECESLNDVLYMLTK